MFKSKWNYIAVGLSGAGALISALTHDGTLLAVNLVLVVINWYGGEYKQRLENSELLVQYELIKAQSAAQAQDPQTPNE